MKILVKILLSLMFLIWFTQETLWALRDLNIVRGELHYRLASGVWLDEWYAIGGTMMVFGLALCYVVYRGVGKIID